MSRVLPSLSLANSAIGICSIGNVVCAPFQRRHHQPADLRIAQVLGRRLLRALQQLLAVDDLHDAALVGAVAEVDAVALRPGRDRPVQVGRHRAGRARLLADQAEVADLHRLGRIAEVVDLRHARACASPSAPETRIGDAGVAFPPVLVRVLQPAGDAATSTGVRPDRRRSRSRAPRRRRCAACRPHWRSPFGSVLPSQTRTICAPPSSYLPSWPGNVRRYFGLAGR